MRFAFLALAAAVALQPLAAQNPASLVEEARQAYLRLDLAGARTLAERALAGASATSPARADALMLLGTIAVLQSRADDAGRRFEALILMAPLYAPDTLTTTSTVLQAFQATRERVKATVLEAPGPQRGVGPDRPFRATIRVSSLHDVMLVVLGVAGDTVDVLWSGPVAERQTVSWVPGEDVAGSLMLVSASMVGGRVAREVRVPLEITRGPVDTLPWPPRPQLEAVTGRVPATWQPLAAGLGLGAAIVLVPAIAGSSAGMPARIVIATGAGAAGIFGYTRARRPDLGAAQTANAVALAGWEAARQRIIQENARRRSGSVADIRTGSPERREGGRP